MPEHVSLRRRRRARVAELPLRAATSISYVSVFEELAPALEPGLRELRR